LFSQILTTKREKDTHQLKNFHLLMDTMFI